MWFDWYDYIDIVLWKIYHCIYFQIDKVNYIFGP